MNNCTIKLRSSNFELLRLIAIFFVILHHLIIKSASTCGYMKPYNIDEDGIIGLIINSLVVGGVNLFILISGWFGVKHIFRQIIRLVLDCFIYSLISNLFCILVLGYPFNLHDLLFSCNFLNNWFVVSFVLFLMMVPVINRALTNIDRKTLEYYVLLYTVVNIIFGFMLGQLNTNGYNALNFIYIYLIGRYLRMILQDRKIIRFVKTGYIIWLLCAIPLTVGFVLLSQHSTWTPNIAQRYFGYNNPIVMIATISIFIPFTQMNFQSNFINAIARGVFGVFLLHTTSISIYYRVHYIGSYYQQYGYISIILWAIILFIGCTIVAYIIERLKTPLYNKLFSLTNNFNHHNI